MGTKKTDLPKTRDRRISSVSEREGFLPEDQRKQAQLFIKENKKKILKGELHIQKIPKGSLIKKMDKKRKAQAQELFKLNNQVLDFKRSVLLFPDAKKKNIKGYIQYAGKEKALGFGGFGKVKFGEDLDTRERVAIKTVYFDESELKRFLEEVSHTKAAGWAKFAMHRVKGKPGFYAGYIVLPLAKASLENYCGENGPGIKTFSEKLKLSVSVMEDLVRLHDLGILHRDVKPGNILFDPLTHQGHLLDFGLAKKMSASQRQDGVKLHEVAGSFGYMAPEIFSYDNNLMRTYSEKSDVFAMGEVFKWFGLDKHASTLDPDIQNMIRDLMARMTREKPEERPQDEEIIITLLKVQKWQLTQEYAEKAKLKDSNRKVLQAELNTALNTVNQKINGYQKKLIERNYTWSKFSIKDHFVKALEYNPNAFVLLRRKKGKQFQVEQFELFQKLHAVYSRETAQFRKEPDPILLEACRMAALVLSENLRLNNINPNHALRQNLNVILKDIKNIQAKKALSHQALQDPKNLKIISAFMKEIGVESPEIQGLTRSLAAQVTADKPVRSDLRKVHPISDKAQGPASLKPLSHKPPIPGSKPKPKS